MRTRPGIQNQSFIALIVLVSLATFWLVLPFFGAILWAVILAMLFWPVHRAIQRRLGRPGLAAALSLAICIVLVVIPGIAILGALAQEASGLFQMIRTRQFDPAAALDRLRAALPEGMLVALAELDLGDYESLRARITGIVLGATQALATQLLLIGQGTARFVISLAVMLYLLFFLFRDGSAITASIRAASPLAQEHTDHIIAKFTAVIRAAVQGNFAIAFAQGLVGGVTFWAMGFQGALILGLVMTGLSLLPGVGAFMVWLPIAVYLLLVGFVSQGAALMAVGLFVITAIDYGFRPILVGKSTRMPNYAILISTMGGIALMGINGFVIGPVIAALFISVWSLFALEKAGRT